MRLFVYGSLMRGEPAHHLLGSARLLGGVCTAAGHRLVVYAGFPGLVVDPAQAGCVAGECYQLDAAAAPATLATLDAYEDAPILYARAEIELADGSRALAWLLNPPALEQAQAFTPAGPIADWRRRAAD